MSAERIRIILATEGFDPGVIEQVVSKFEAADYPIQSLRGWALRVAEEKKNDLEAPAPVSSPQAPSSSSWPTETYAEQSTYRRPFKPQDVPYESWVVTLSRRDLAYELADWRRTLRICEQLEAPKQVARSEECIRLVEGLLRERAVA